MADDRVHTAVDIIEVLAKQLDETAVMLRRLAAIMADENEEEETDGRQTDPRRD